MLVEPCNKREPPRSHLFFITVIQHQFGFELSQFEVYKWLPFGTSCRIIWERGRFFLATQRWLALLTHLNIVSPGEWKVKWGQGRTCQRDSVISGLSAKGSCNENVWKTMLDNWAPQQLSPWVFIKGLTLSWCPKTNSVFTVSFFGRHFWKLEREKMRP